MNALPEPKLPDEYYAKEIRDHIKSLSEIVKRAKDDGLIVELNLQNLGHPSWVGYHDAAKIIRKY